MSGSEWTSHVPIDCVSVQSCQCGADEACKYVREIERLRALLSEALLYFGLQTVAHGLQVPHPLGVRIREALGDD